MYIGDWRLKVQGDEELYLLTSLEGTWGQQVSKLQK